MRSIVLGFGVAGALLLGCGSDVVEPLRCSTGPLLTTTSEPCQLTVEGSDGPTSARLIWLHASDDLYWADVSPASDAGLYLLAEAEGPELVVVRLGPALEHEWSLALAHEAESAGFGPFTVGPAGFDLVSRATRAGDSTSWLTHVDDAGRCSDSTQLVLGGDTAPNVQSLVRDGERLVVGGIAYPDRAFVQSRSASDAVVAETELLVEWGYIQAFSLYRGGPKRYLAHYQAYAPQGFWSNYFGNVWLDEALTSPSPVTGGDAGFDLLSYQSDADGRLYSVVRDAWDFESPDTPPPTSLSVTRQASETSPSGEPRELMVPQPDCGSLSVRVRDEALQVVHCNADESLLGYASAGAPTWTATLACPSAAALQLGRMHFDAAGRSWSLGSVEGERVLVLLEW